MDLIRSIDKSILFGVEALYSPVLNSILIFITHLNDKGYLFIAIGLFLLVHKKYRKAGIAALLALLFSLLVTNMALKNLVQRVRPFITYGIEPLVMEHSWSFPSGHTSSAFAGAAAITAAQGWKKGIPFLLLAALIGFTRIYVQVHYFTDVLAGAAVGSLCGVLSCAVVNRVGRIIRRR